MGGEYPDDVGEQLLPHPKLYLMQQVDRKQRIHIDPWEAFRKCILKCHININGRYGTLLPTLIATLDFSRILSTRDPETTNPLKMAFRALVTRLDSPALGTLLWERR